MCLHFICYDMIIVFHYLWTKWSFGIQPSGHPILPSNNENNLKNNQEICKDMECESLSILVTACNKNGKWHTINQVT